MAEITQTGFDKLLQIFDSNRENAGIKYENLRLRLIKFFDWRNCENSEELADTVFDRIIKKIIEGEEIQNINAYSATIAQFVFKEYCRRNERKFQSIEDNPNIQELKSNENFVEKLEQIKDIRQSCFEKCLRAFDVETQKLLISYHDTDERTMIHTRKRLAEQLNLNINTLRIKICRYKSKLENCTHNCCDEKK